MTGAMQYLRSFAFLSTLSLRRATSAPVTDKAWALISIHALLAESDVGINLMASGN